VDDARAIYFEYHDKRMLYARTGADAIKEDFVTLRKAGYSHKLMIDVERRRFEAICDERSSGTTGESGADGQSMQARPQSQTPAPAVRPAAAEAMPALSEREDIEAGHTLLSQGRLDEALDVYKRRVNRCDKILANGVPNMQASEDRHIVVNKVSEIALGHVLAGQYEKALATLDYAMSVVPLSAFANVRRAHALMFLGRNPEARALYLQYREQRMTAQQTGANVILQDFERMRKVEHVDPLMDEIETLFGAPNPEQPPRLMR
jgi:tetratricopeptide (TPR) repeat protein